MYVNFLIFFNFRFILCVFGRIGGMIVCKLVVIVLEWVIFLVMFSIIGGGY